MSPFELSVRDANHTEWCAMLEPQGAGICSSVLSKAVACQASDGICACMQASSFGSDVGSQASKAGSKAQNATSQAAGKVGVPGCLSKS